MTAGAMPADELGPTQTKRQKKKFGIGSRTTLVRKDATNLAVENDEERVSFAEAGMIDRLEGAVIREGG